MRIAGVAGGGAYAIGQNRGMTAAEREQVAAQQKVAFVPFLLEGVADLARQGYVTGASGRNWAGYGRDVQLPASLPPQDQALLTDPQTSGGLLVACRPEALDQVLAIFRAQGFDQAAVVGRVVEGPARLVVSA